MKRRKWGIVMAAVLAGLPLMSGCDSTTRYSTGDEGERTAGQELDDKNLTAKVKSALSDDSTKFPDVQVAVYKGTVQLSGFADSSDQKGRAADIAKNVAGVRDVVNNISVKEARKP